LGSRRPDHGQAPMGSIAPKPKGKLVLVVEDESDLADMLKLNIEREGYSCRCATSGDAALRLAGEHHPDLVIVDRMLPGLSGDEVVLRLKREPATAGLPVIMLTAKAEETDQLVGFALGADDYVTKPFSMKVLVARINAHLRRAEQAEADPDVLSGGPIRLFPSRHEVTVDGREVVLTATEFKLLRVLMAARGRVLDRSRLIDKVFGTGFAVTDRTIDVHMTALRKKLGGGAGWLQTVRGVGYTFRPPS